MIFGRFIVRRLHAARAALKSGNLDEAFRLSTSAELTDHRQVRSFRKDLARALIERARKRFRSDQFAESLVDLDRALACGHHLEEARELREQVIVVANEAQKHQAKRANQLHVAREKLEAGSLDGGRRILAAHASDPVAQDMEKSINRRAAEADALIKEAKRFHQSRQTLEAISKLQSVKRINAHHVEIGALQKGLIAECLDQASKALGLGQLGACEDWIRRIESLEQGNLEALAVRRSVDAVKQAAQAFQANQFQGAREKLESIVAKGNGLKWIAPTIKQLKTVEDIQAKIKAGQLGTVDVGAVSDVRHAIPVPMSTDSNMEDTVVVAKSPRNRENQAWLMLVDGGGSFLILMNERNAIGRHVSAQAPDVPILSDLRERHAEIARVDEDYFLFSPERVEVAGRAGQQHLLRDGDRVVLGKRAKMTFRIPSRRSLSAVLQLSETTKAPGDIRNVVLFHDHATLGNGPTAHFQSKFGTGRVLIFEREGRLYAKDNSSPGANRTAIEIRPGESVEILGNRFVIQPWKPVSKGWA